MPTFLFVHTSLSVHCCASARRLRKKQGIKSSKLTAANSCSEVGGRSPYGRRIFSISRLQGLHQLALKN
ncbi:hypothetical protein Peur_041520 [Populus x canadensis]